MEPSNFVHRWESYISRTGLSTKSSLIRLTAPDVDLSPGTIQFLTEAGLPNAAGLDFSDLEDGLQPVYELYGNSADWSEQELERLSPFFVLGCDGGGNPICLNAANNDTVVFLLHEEDFAEGEYVNSGVAQLAECLLAFQEMVEVFQRDQGQDAELYYGNVPPSLVEQTINKFRQIDPNAVEEGSYWAGKMENI